MPAAALRREGRASLVSQWETATTLGRDHLGLPISSGAMASLLWNEFAEGDARLGASHSRRSGAHPDLVGNAFPTARDLLAIVRPTA